MNNFGLGLVLNFTDNATAGLQRATGAFNELNSVTTAFSNADSVTTAMMQISAGAGILGNNLYNVGNRITSFYTGIISQINNVGTQMLSANSQLSTLYGSEEAGAETLKRIKEYAKESIFNFEDLIPSVIMLKANGIEAFDEIATSAYRASGGVEGYKQTLMDYAADLAAFNPNMMNQYGVGVQAAMGALNEYIAEGNTMSLKRGASLDILQLLGEEKGKTIEERSRQVADLIEQLGMVSMTADLAGTPMQRLANVEDLFFNLASEIADSGVFEEFTALIAKLTDYLFIDISDEEWSNIAQVIGSAFTDLLKLLEPLVDILIEVLDKAREFIRENPELVTNIIKYSALVGVFTLITGAVLKVLSAVGMLKFALSMLFNGGGLAGGFNLVGLFSNLIKYVLPLASLFTLIKAVWDRDLNGIQDKVKNTFKDLWDSVRLVFDAFTDNTLSVENFERAEQLGLLPFIESILQLKYHWQFFVEGFKKGFDSFIVGLSNVLVKMGFLKEGFTGFRDLLTKVFEKMTQEGMTDTWEKVGEVVGKVVGWLMLLSVVVPVVLKIFGVILSIITFLKTAFTVVKGFFTAVGTIFLTLTNTMSALPTAVVGLLVVLKAVLIGGLIAITVAIWKKVITMVRENWQDIKDFFPIWWNDCKELFREIGISIAQFFENIWDNIVRTFSTVINYIYGNFIQPVVEFFGQIYENITQGVESAHTFVSNIFDSAEQKVNKVGQTFKNVFTSVKDWIVNAMQVVSDTVSSVIDWISEKLGAISNAMGSIVDSVSGALNWAGEKLQGAGDALSNLVGLSTGGYVKTTGIAVLHPNEVVVNDKLTQQLGAFLDRQSNDPVDVTLPSPLPVPPSPNRPVPVNSTMVTNSEDNRSYYSPMETFNNSTETSTVNNKYGANNYDYSVVFDTGSIVVSVTANGGKIEDKDLDEMAEQIMKKIQRKQQIRGMQTRK